ncbi:RNA repair transcriptional activator RtcR family protein [Oceanihabitans sp. 2_MG-2023]|uniref:RNA repair transcriptional activator RtcR family protein n=1 Tax=Oceanihabitans sp. 2_MG-2023 TaxID=3062661 RepID=UPI0026E31242|nr:RNA repair transcriptional activator RtcR family protein [Oceanihabitans sp. 2_MG-2023]MDO6597259.1 RNA repair transcriptional activator RtcR family protein [Oceanihabitans sp. 2_MG-2023]
MKNKQILLTWDAFNNGFVVTAKVLKSLLLEKKVSIDFIYYLQNQELSDENLAEIDVFFERKKYGEVLKKFDDERIIDRIKENRAISESLKLETEVLPKFQNKRVSINGVTNYQSIYDSLITFLKDKIYDRENIDLHINISPGTPQMHVVWLMLNSAGYLPANTTLWSSQYDKTKKKTYLEEVRFTPNIFLSELLNKKYLNNAHRLNPNETKSQKRKAAESRLALFSHIPNASILLLGERGTGKSTYVRELIVKKYNKDYPFSELACGTFSEELMKSELFGYKKGAFTGAVKDKEGILSKFTKGGVLFLDEIQDLSKSLQRQLIQVLQTGNYFPLGADQPEKTNFRLIAASNISFSDLTSNMLDYDFFDRISRFIVQIPSLRECQEDFVINWQNVWNDISSFEDAPSVIWNDKIHGFLKSKKLYGNYRDMQKLASYILAFYFESHKKDVAVDKAIKEFEKWNVEKASSDKSYFVEGKTYNEMVAKFNKELAEWSINNYGNKKKASGVLNRSESMLSKDLKMDRLK